MQNQVNVDLSGKRLVVFGCGYIGRAVALRALAQGAGVVALTRNPDKAARLRLEGIDVVEADLASEDWHQKITGEADFVLNSVSSGGGGVSGYRRSYFEGMQSVLAWTQRGSVGTLVYTSSTSVYPQGDHAIVTEMAEASGRNENAKILVAAEDLLRNFTKAESPSIRRWFIFRLAGIYGPERHSLLDQLRSGVSEIGGNADHCLNLIHRDDAASAILAAFTAPRSLANEIMNLADDSPAPKFEVVRWLAQQLQVTPPAFGHNESSARRGPVPDRVICNAKAKGLLGWHPEFSDFRAGYEKILSL